MENKNSSRVYINPNFNRGTLGSTMPLTSNAHPNAYYPNAQNSKIYINPKFLPQSIPQPVQSANQYSSKPNEGIKYVTNSLSSNTNTFHDNQLKQNQQTMTTNSRFSLVRCNENKPQDIKPEKKESLTVNVSKYKSVRIADVKLRLDKDKQLPKQLNNSTYTQSNPHVSDQKQRNGNIITSSKDFQTQYTYVKGIGTDNTNTGHKTIKTQYSHIKIKETPKRMNTSKQAANMSFRRTPKIKIRKIKVKCYTPCKKFKKYGKCIKHAKGHCKYLHDKKHVSICRKFLKGFCRDNNCLLSHELSDKKMPTCYFYLQGMCTKENCPYLHVKVNENAMVCPEFKKGYCEKGSTCLYRHVETKKKRAKKNKKQVDPATSTYRLKKNYSDKYRTQNIPKQDAIVPSVSQEETAVTDCRYYKEVIGNDETYDSHQVIKPTRCKLGTLPSFIKF